MPSRPWNQPKKLKVIAPTVKPFIVSRSVGKLLVIARTRIIEAIENMDFDREVHVVYNSSIRTWMIFDTSDSDDLEVINHLKRYPATPKPMPEPEYNIIDSHVWWYCELHLERFEDSHYIPECYKPKFGQCNIIGEDSNDTEDDE